MEKSKGNCPPTSWVEVLFPGSCHMLNFFPRMPPAVCTTSARRLQRHVLFVFNIFLSSFFPCQICHDVSLSWYVSCFSYRKEKDPHKTHLKREAGMIFLKKREWKVATQFDSSWLKVETRPLWPLWISQVFLFDSRYHLTCDFCPDNVNEADRLEVWQMKIWKF